MRGVSSVVAHYVPEGLPADVEEEVARRLTKALRRCRSEFYVPGGPLERWAWVWILGSLAKDKRSEVAEIPRWWGVQRVARFTDRVHRRTDYPTVGDFLLEPDAKGEPGYRNYMTAEACYAARFHAEGGSFALRWVAARADVDWIQAQVGPSVDATEMVWRAMGDAGLSVEEWSIEFEKKPLGRPALLR